MFYSRFVFFSVYKKTKLQFEFLYTNALYDQNTQLLVLAKLKFIFLEIYKLFWSNSFINVSNIDRRLYYSNELLWAFVFQGVKIQKV